MSFSFIPEVDFSLVFLIFPGMDKFLSVAFPCSFVSTTPVQDPFQFSCYLWPSCHISAKKLSWGYFVFILGTKWIFFCVCKTLPKAWCGVFLCVGCWFFFFPPLSSNSNILKVFSFSYVTLIMISYLQSGPQLIHSGNLKMSHLVIITFLYCKAAACFIFVPKWRRKSPLSICGYKLHDAFL